MCVTVDQCDNLEKYTKDQAKSKMWFRYCAGRVTASNFKLAVKTNLTNPSQSLITSVCYPESRKFYSKTTR
jgi:hypothetical protein